jgi:hypothetical protein
MSNFPDRRTKAMEGRRRDRGPVRVGDELKQQPSLSLSSSVLNFNNEMPRLQPSIQRSLNSLNLFSSVWANTVNLFSTEADADDPALANLTIPVMPREETASFVTSESLKRRREE